jgi:serine O-acetyltransferase
MAMERSFADELLRIRRQRAPILPVQEEVGKFGEAVLRMLFPHFSDEKYFTAEEIDAGLRLLGRDLSRVLAPLSSQIPRGIDDVGQEFFSRLPAIHEALWLDAEAINAGDPAAESVDEVVSAYPGFYAIAIYRIAHEFYRLEVPIFPRILAEMAHHRSGIDIHPGATIGKSFFIDHGTGIVIGETTVIGDHVKIYQGVTLGALSVEKSLSASKRHPTIEDNVVIYSNATILGGKTVIGHDSVIGGNVWLTESIPPFSVVYHKSEVKVRNREGDESVAFVI